MNYDLRVSQEGEELKRRRLLLELTVKLSHDQADVIYLYEGDSIDQVAQAFCLKHGLEVQKVIADNLRANLGEKENYFSFVNQKNNNFHERLYQDALAKKSRLEKLQAQTKSDNNLQLHHKEALPKTNLYEKQLKQLQYKEKSLEQQRLVREQQQLEQATFKPQLSQNTIKIAQQTRQHRNKTPEYYLIQYGQRIKDQRKQQEQNLINQTTRECTFRPEINSSFSPHQRQKSANRFEQLYQQQKKVYLKQEESYSFKPSINKLSQNRSYAPFLERVEIQQRIKGEKKKQEEDESCFDPKSGQRLFHPSIITTQRSRGGLSIGDYLYKQTKPKDESFVLFDCNEVSKSMQTDRSQKIVLDMRRRRLEELFQMLDSDQDGFISANKINLDTLPTDALILLEPVIVQLEELDIYMNQESWVEKCFEQIEKLSVTDRNRLFLKPKATVQCSQEMTHTGKPQINQKSEQMVRHKQKLSLYEKGIREMQEKQLRAKKMKQYNEEREIRECTFQPKIN